MNSFAITTDDAVCKALYDKLRHRTLHGKLAVLTEEQIVAGARPLAQRSGLYFLIKAGKIVYVGQSASVDSRVYIHGLDQTKDFDSWAFLSCPAEERKALERAYIDKFDPPLNIDPVTMNARHGRSRKRDRSSYGARIVTTPLGVFSAIGEAAKAHGVSRQAIYSRVQNGSPGWSIAKKATFSPQIPLTAALPVPRKPPRIRRR